MKILWYILTFLFGLFGVLATIRVVERLVSGVGVLPVQLLLALLLLGLAVASFRQARGVH